MKGGRLPTPEKSPWPGDDRDPPLPHGIDDLAYALLALRMMLEDDAKRKKNTRSDGGSPGARKRPDRSRFESVTLG